MADTADKTSLDIAVIGGDGIGPEVVAEGLKVLEVAAGDVKVSTTEYDLGAARWHRTGETLPASVVEELKGHDGEPVIAQLNMSWATRVRRDDLVTFHVDGTHGSAVAGLQECRAQSHVATPRPIWNPDVKQTMNFFEQWQEIPDSQDYDNGFKIQWEHFIRHVVEDAPYTWTLPEGAKGVQLVEAALASWKERRWVAVPQLEV